MSPLSIQWGNGNIGVIITRMIDGVMTTSVYVFPGWIVVAVIAGILIPIWIVRRRRDNDNSS